MNIYLDTSALLAVLNAGDQFHLPARDKWRKVLSSDANSGNECAAGCEPARSFPGELHKFRNDA